MASRGLGSLTLDLILKMGGFEAGMDKAARVADKRMRQIEKRAYQFGKVLGTTIAVGATAAFTGLALATKAAIDQADAMRDLSIRVGVSTETLSAYGYAAKQTGTDVEALGRGLKILAKNAADALNPTSEQAKVFGALGIHVTDATGKLKNLDQLVPEIADKFKRLEDGTTKAALAQALFGKSGLELTEFLNQGADGLDAFARKAAELGIVIDSKTAAAADDFNDTLGDLKAVVSGLGLGIARELLPVMKDTVQDLIDLVKEGNLAANMATVLGAAFSAAAGILSGYTKAVQVTSAAMEYMIRVGNAWLVIQKNMSTFGFADGTISGAVKDIKAATAEGDAALRDIHKPKKRGLFDNVVSKVNSGSASPIDSRALALALSNPTASRGGSKKAGKSEAEREAERLKAAYDNLIASQQEQIALFGKTTEAAQVRYDTEFGALKGLSQAQKDAAIANAERLDQMRAEADVQKDLDEANKRREEAYKQVISDIQAESDQLGMNIEQQDTYNKLKYAGVDANSAWGQSIIAANQALHQQAKAMAASIEIQDEWRSGLADAITDAVTGAKSLKEAFTDFFDSFAAMVTQMIAKRWVEQLFGETGSNGGGSGGNLLSQLLGGLFGGGGFGGTGSPLAAGGYTDPSKFHEVGENDRPEFLYRGGKQYLIPGNRGRVVPMRGGSGVSQTNIFQLAAPTDPRTQTQIAAKVAFETNRASGRNR